MTDAPKSTRGLGALTPERQREIAVMGGQSVAPENRSFSRNRDLAQAAGKIGGTRSGGNFKVARERAVEAGRKGGRKSGAKFGHSQAMALVEARRRKRAKGGDLASTAGVAGE